jgi:hypothetical protein
MGDQPFPESVINMGQNTQLALLAEKDLRIPVKLISDSGFS